MNTILLLIVCNACLPASHLETSFCCVWLACWLDLTLYCKIYFARSVHDCSCKQNLCRRETRQIIVSILLQAIKAFTYILSSEQTPSPQCTSVLFFSNKLYMYRSKHFFDRLNDAATIDDETPNAISNTIFVFSYLQRFKNISSSFLFIKILFSKLYSKKPRYKNNI